MVSVISRLLSLMIGYGCGLFQTAYIYGRTQGVDIRSLGSGNAGTTNVLRNFGRRAGIYVFAGDLAKSMAALLIVWLIFRGRYPDSVRLLMTYAGLGAIVGHCFPFYMQFRGGKGIACTAGLIIGFSPILAIIGVVVFFGLLALTHYVSLCSLMLTLSFFLGTVVMGQMGVWNMPPAALYEMYLVVFMIMALTWFQHRTNIKRLLAGTETRTYIFKKNRK